MKIVQRFSCLIVTSPCYSFPLITVNNSQLHLSKTESFKISNLLFPNSSSSVRKESNIIFCSQSKTILFCYINKSCELLLKTTKYLVELMDEVSKELNDECNPRERNIFLTPSNIQEKQHKKN